MFHTQKKGPHKREHSLVRAQRSAKHSRECPPHLKCAITRSTTTRWWLSWRLTCLSWCFRHTWDTPSRGQPDFFVCKYRGSKASLCAWENFLAAVVVFLLGRFVGVKKFCVLGNNELYTVMFLFLSLNFVGAIVRNFEVIIFWISPMRKFCFKDFTI